ncbi:MAG TPA: glycosyltransferase family 4 protein [Solirubrobacteraceae bacterium]|nr:glycosyltransferase family 4 protein [Solirubrobacteraceae bacterium]
MRILCIGSMYPPHHLGGYELVWQAAVDDLRARGHDVRVLTADHREPDAAGLPEPADVHRDLRWYWRDHAFPRLGPRARLGLERHNAATFDRHLDDFRPDVVAWWAMGGMSLSLLERARRTGLPAVAFVNDAWLIYGPLVDAWIRFATRPGVPADLLERVTGLPARFDPQASAHFVFASEDTRRASLERWPSIAGSQVAHGGIDRTFLAGPVSPGDWAWRLLYVGRIDPRKGIATAIHAVGLLPADTTLRVVGGGDETHLGELRELADRLGLADRVSFDGARPRDELPGIYAAADVVVFPVEWAEPWGLVPLEAMACDRPVVATGTGGSAEYLRDGENALLHPPGDPAALADRISCLAGDADLRARLRSGGLATARAHTDEAFHARVEAVLANACAGRLSA